MTFSNEYNSFDLRTRKIASHISTEARIRDLRHIKENVARKHRRIIADIDELIKNLQVWNRITEQALEQSKDSPNDT